MRSLFLLFVLAFLAGGCASTSEARPARRTETQQPPPTNPARDAIFSEAVTASQVVERDGLRCLQALDSYGNVVEEECVAADAAR